MTRQNVMTHNANGYSHGCRCDTCKAAHNERMRAYFQDRGGNPYRKITPKVACKAGCGRQIRGGTCRFCTREARARLARQRRAQVKLGRAAQGTQGDRVWVCGPCGHCGVAGVRRGLYCSRRCAVKARNFNRRALEAGCKVTPGRRRDVHERDGWICKLCGFPVDRLAVVPALEAPVIDHIVSLARGGDHAPHNWQTAHFLCNSYKRDLDMVDVA